MRKTLQLLSDIEPVYKKKQRKNKKRKEVSKNNKSNKSKQREVLEELNINININETNRETDYSETGRAVRKWARS